MLDKMWDIWPIVGLSIVILFVATNTVIGVRNILRGKKLPESKDNK